MRFFLILALLLFQEYNIQFNPPPAGGGGGQTFSDDFDRGDGGPGANWTQQNGSPDIVTNEMDFAAAGNEEAVYSGTATDTEDQWACVQWTGAQNRLALIIRSENVDTNTYYVLRYDGAFQWRYCTTQSCTTVESDTNGLVTDDYFCVEVTGTGTDTEMIGYDCGTSNPCATPAPPSTQSGICTADTTMTTDPGSAADVGRYVGIASYAGGANQADNFCGGDI